MTSSLGQMLVALLEEEGERQPGVPFQGASGRWFVKRQEDGRVVPAKAPDSEAGGSATTSSEKEIEDAEPQTVEDHNAFFAEAGEPDLTDEEKTAINHYTDVGTFKDLNAALRGGAVNDPRLQRIHQRLQSAFSKVKPFDRPILTARGVSFTDPNMVQEFVHLARVAQAEGGVLRMPGYTSTTSRLTGTGDWRNAPVQLKIAATHGLNVKPYSQFKKENEVLLNHDSRFRVKQIEEKGGQHIIHLEQIPPGRIPTVDAGQVRDEQGPIKPEWIEDPTADRGGVERLVRWYLQQKGLDPASADPGKVARALGRYASGINDMHTSQAIRTIQAMQATNLMKPMHNKLGLESGPTPEYPDESRPPDLTDAEKLAAQKYTVAYRHINDSLRTGKPAPPGTAQIHKDLESALAKVKPFSKPVKVYRGVNLSLKQYDQLNQQLARAAETGQPISMKGWTSTATEPLAQHKGNVEFHVDAVHGLDVKPYSHFPGTKELLLGHDSQYRVKAVRNREGGGMIVELEQLPPGEKGEAPETVADAGRRAERFGRVYAGMSKLMQTAGGA